MGVVYVATCRLSGKRYVGKTTLSLDRRIRGHLKDAKAGRGHLFHRAIRKYGKNGFRWEILLVSDSIEELNNVERLCILRLRTKSPDGYNLTDGGEGIEGASLETRVKMSLSLKGKRKSVEHRRKLSEAHKGKKLSAATKEKLRMIHVGAKRSEETRRKIAEGNRGRVHSEESKAKMREKHLGKVLSAETRAKMSVSQMGNTVNVGRLFSEEHKANISSGLMGRVYSRETRKKMSDSMKRTLQNKRDRKRT